MERLRITIAGRLLLYAAHSAEATALIDALLPGEPASYSLAAQRETLDKVEALLKERRRGGTQSNEERRRAPVAD